MKPHISLRIASLVVLLQAIAHTIGGVFGTPPPGAGASAVAAMKADHFLVTGFDRTYWIFFIGFGLAITISLLVESAVLWLLASLAKTTTLQLRPILAVFLVGHVAMGVLSWLCFFPPPVIGNVIIALCLSAAILTSGRAELLPMHRT